MFYNGCVDNISVSTWMVKRLSSVTVTCRSTRTPSVFRSWYFVIPGWRLQAVSASPVRRVDFVLKYLQLLKVLDEG